MVLVKIQHIAFENNSHKVFYSRGIVNYAEFEKRD